MSALRSALAEFLPSWLLPKLPTPTPTSKSVPQGGSRPAGGGGNTSGSNGP
jgi:hypothetical protein